jgi:hypothetical protein
MLKKDIPTEKITGIVVMHAEKYAQRTQASHTPDLGR